MSFPRSEPPFFHDPEVHHLIEKIASQQSLVIYAGAGVSIDRTGLSWTDLIDNMLKKHKTDDVRRAIMSTNTPLQAASIVSQLYVDRSDEWKSEIANDLKSLLYEGHVWQEGTLTRAVVELAAALVDKGKDYYLVTTNYDDFIQKEMRALDAKRELRGKERIEPSVSVIDHDVNSCEFDVNLHNRPGQIVHLHGYVPKTGIESTAVILSEHDYILSNRYASAVLEDLFTNNSVVIVGSGFVDPPLLDALARTKSLAADEQSGSARLRVAIMPLQGMHFPDNPDKTMVEEVKKSVESRMRLFGVDVLFPDFFYQVPQLLTEVRVCVDSCEEPHLYSSNASSIRYGLRLSSWWRSWWNVRSNDWRDHQMRDHEKLRESLESIRQQLHVHHDELMKLEIWVRWKPEGGRELRLWASTASLWVDVDLMRCAPIESESRYDSVNAFCLGQPQIYPRDKDEARSTDHHGDRWVTQLCVPTRIGEDVGELPVAVITLASMKQKDSSKITEKHGVAIKAAIREMRKVAAEITSTSSER